MVKKIFLDDGLSEELSDMWSKDVSRAFGATESDKNMLSQLAQLSDLEIVGTQFFCQKICSQLKSEVVSDTTILEIKDLQDKRETKKKAEDIAKINDQIANKIRPHVLELGKTSVDIAMFGRMLASSPEYNIEAAVQVAHAITVNQVKIEDDFFTAVDDLNKHDEDSGAGHMGEAGFGSGIFYLYLCINKTQLINNLQDEALASQAIQALIETAAKVSPTGKQNSFASRTYTSYLLAEKGTQQPRSLSVAFLKAVKGDDPMGIAITALENQRNHFDAVYGSCADSQQSMNAQTGQGSLSTILQFVAG